MILFHLPQLCRNQGLPYFLDAPIFNRGVEAVYMFFVLSGYLIIRIVFIKKQANTFSIRKFYIRRILRIFPLYYLIVIFGFLYYWWILPQLNIPFQNNYPLEKGILLTTFFLPNVLAFEYAPGGVLEVLWSLGIEEQFYLVIAPLLFIINKKFVLVFLILLTSIYFSIYHFDYIEILRKYRFVYFLLFFGGIIAILEEKNQLSFLKKHSLFPLSISILTLLYFTTDIFKFENIMYYNFVTMVLFGLFIHVLSENNRGIQIKNKFFNYLGKISYGIYVFHIISLNFVVFLMLKIQEFNLLNDTVIILTTYFLTFAITIIISHLSYQYVESYFLKLKGKYK